MKFFYHYYCTVCKDGDIIHSSGTYTTTKKIINLETFVTFRNTVVDLIKKDGYDIVLKDLNVVSLNLLHVEEDIVVDLPELKATTPGKGA